MQRQVGQPIFFGQAQQKRSACLLGDKCPRACRPILFLIIAVTGQVVYFDGYPILSKMRYLGTLLSANVYTEEGRVGRRSWSQGRATRRRRAKDACNVVKVTCFTSRSPTTTTSSASAVPVLDHSSNFLFITPSQFCLLVCRL